MNVPLECCFPTNYKVLHRVSYGHYLSVRPFKWLLGKQESSKGHFQGPIVWKKQISTCFLTYKSIILMLFVLFFHVVCKISNQISKPQNIWGKLRTELTLV